jgi:hypothetical protein
MRHKPDGRWHSQADAGTEDGSDAAGS